MVEIRLHLKLITSLPPNSPFELTKMCCTKKMERQKGLKLLVNLQFAKFSYLTLC